MNYRGSLVRLSSSRDFDTGLGTGSESFQLALSNPAGCSLAETTGTATVDGMGTVVSSAQSAAARTVTYTGGVSGSISGNTQSISFGGSGGTFSGGLRGAFRATGTNGVISFSGSFSSPASIVGSFSGVGSYAIGQSSPNYVCGTWSFTNVPFGSGDTMSGSAENERACPC
ncbi:MAG: hypothetical protein ACLQNE_30995 [Thermoguttaceae bacterium]